MIYFYKSDLWEEFGEKYMLDRRISVIDTRGCLDEGDFVRKVGEVIRGTESVELINGNSLDALSDVAFDYFMENWLIEKRIYSLGWKRFTTKYPLFAQQLLSSIVGAYQTAIWGQARAIYEGDSSVADTKIHAEIEGCLRVCLFLN
jgi:hypothetical protein